MNKLASFFGLNESARPTDYDSSLDGTPEDAEALLRQAVSNGQEVPSLSKRQYRVWRLGGNYIGATIHDGGWALIWTAPVSTSRLPTDDTSAPSGVGVLDPHSSEIDDYAFTVNWIDPDTADSIMGSNEN
jgi:hypothetical protein